MKENVDHAVRSRDIVAPFINQFDFSNEEKETILETILNHHNPALLKNVEAVLLRDADAIDFLGFIGIACDSRACRKTAQELLAIFRTGIFIHYLFLYRIWLLPRFISFLLPLISYIRKPVWPSS